MKNMKKISMKTFEKRTLEKNVSQKVFFASSKFEKIFR